MAPPQQNSRHARRSPWLSLSVTGSLTFAFLVRHGVVQAFAPLARSQPRSLVAMQAEKKEMSPALKAALARMRNANAKADEEAKIAEEKQMAIRQSLADATPYSFTLDSADQAALFAEELDGIEFQASGIGMSVTAEGDKVVVKTPGVSKLSLDQWGSAKGTARLFFTRGKARKAQSPMGILWCDVEGDVVEGFGILHSEEHPATEDELKAVKRVAEARPDLDIDGRLSQMNLPKAWLQPMLDARGILKWSNVNQFTKNLR